MKAKIYNTEGKEVESISLPEEIFGLPWKSDLVYQVVNSQLSSSRTNVAHAKTRAEVRGGGKKPWKQKGTGRARHGSSRSPLWVGGGTTHGPRNDKNYDRKINKKAKAKTLFMILSQKYRDNELVFVDDISVKEPKAKIAKSIFTNLAKGTGEASLGNKRNNRAILALANRDVNVAKSFQNFSNVIVDEVRNMNIVDLMNYKYVVFVNPKDSVEALTKRSAK